MSIAKPFTFTANTYAKTSEVNADFDTVYSQVNSNISAIAQNATDIDNLENNKADINGSSSERFAVANPIANADAVNKQSLMSAIGNSIDYIGGLNITRDSGSPDDTIIVTAGSCYDSTHTVVLSLSASTSKQNSNQGAITTYYVYIIGNSTGSLIDILISSEAVTPTLPTGYSLFRQIGKYTTNSSSKIDVINSYGYNTSIPSASAVIVETYINGTSWYRIWSDKWCEQGGYLSNHQGDSRYATVTFLKGFSDTSYNVVVTPYAAYMDNGICSYCYSKSNNSMVVASAFGNLNSAWQASGYIN